MEDSQLRNLMQKFSQENIYNRTPERAHVYRAARDALWQRDVLRTIRGRLLKIRGSVHGFAGELENALEEIDGVIGPKP